MKWECFKDNQTGEMVCYVDYNNYSKETNIFKAGESFSVAEYPKAFFVDETFDNGQYCIVNAEKERAIVNLEERNYLLKFINPIIDN